MVLGHESSGYVVAAGDKVKSLKPGDRVAIEPGEASRYFYFSSFVLTLGGQYRLSQIDPCLQTCGQCSHCLSGNYQRCHSMIFAATPPFDGTLKALYTLPHHLCYKLPDWLNLEEAAMCEPLSVSLHALRTTGNLRPNQSAWPTFQERPNYVDRLCRCPHHRVRPGQGG